MRSVLGGVMPERARWLATTHQRANDAPRHASFRRGISRHRSPPLLASNGDNIISIDAGRAARGNNRPHQIVTGPHSLLSRRAIYSRGISKRSRLSMEMAVVACGDRARHGFFKRRRRGRRLTTFTPAPCSSRSAAPPARRPQNMSYRPPLHRPASSILGVTLISSRYKMSRNIAHRYSEYESTPGRLRMKYWRW